MENANLHNEKELLLKIAEGDEKAFEHIFYNYHNRLANYIQRFTGSILLTQEIVQDVFLKIWTNRAQLSDVDNFRSFLFVSARNHAFNAIKQLAREYRRKDLWQKQLQEEFNFSAERITYQEMLTKVNKVIRALPQQQKKVFLLSREKGLSHEQIASELDLSIATVKKHMVLALKFLREQIGPNTTVILLFLSTELCFL